MMKDTRKPDYKRIAITAQQIIEASDIIFEEFRNLTEDEALFVAKCHDMIEMTTAGVPGNTNIAMTTLATALLRMQVDSLKEMLAERKRRSSR